MALFSIEQLNKKRISLYSLAILLALILGGFVCDKLIMPAIVNSSRTMPVPNVMGLPKQQAIDLLEGQGLIVQEAREQFNDKVSQGVVFMQLPNPGSMVKEGRHIYLTVSKGNEVISMPDLTMMTRRDAQVALMRLGLAIGNVTTEWKDSVPESRVIRQSFAPGLSVPAGSSVNIVLSKDSATTIIVPSLERLTMDEAMAGITQVQLTLGEVVQEKDETYSAGTVLRQIPPAGTRVKPGSTIKLFVASAD